MPEPLYPNEVPVCTDQEEHNNLYEEAESERTPFFVIDQNESGYSVTYDLLPTGYRLTDDAFEELSERVSSEVEAILRDQNVSTEELSSSPGRSMGNFYFFEEEQTARDFASVISRLVLDEGNWEEEPSPREIALQSAGLDQEDE